MRRWMVGAALGWLLFAPAARADQGLVARWQLDSVSGGVTPETSGNAINAAQSGAPQPTDGRFGGAFRFGAAQDGFLAESPVLQPANVTLSAWVRAATAPPTVKTVAAQGANGNCSNSSYALYTGGSQSSPGLRFYAWNGSVAVVSPAAVNTMWNGQWHVVAGTYDGATARLFVDGLEVGSGTAGQGPIVYGLAHNNKLAIGNYSGNVAAPAECSENTSFPGDIDEVRIFNRALSAAEVAQLPNGFGLGTASPPPPVTPTAPDRDRDGVADSADNCPDSANADQADRDGDRIGNACDVLPPGDLPPLAGQRVTTRLVAGEVTVRLPSGQTAPLQGVASLPVGAVVDARKGRLTVSSARDAKGRLSSASVAAGIFRIRQARLRRGVATVATDFVLATPPGSARACAAGRTRPVKGVVRGLSVVAKGTFRTVGAVTAVKGRNASWTTADTCIGTRTTVRRGKVKLRDGRRTLTVRAGHSHLVRARLFGARRQRAATRG